MLLPHCVIALKKSKAPPEAVSCRDRPLFFFTTTFKANRGCEIDTKNTDFGWSNTLITHIVQVVVDGQKHGVLVCRGAGRV